MFRHRRRGRWLAAAAMAAALLWASGCGTAPAAERAAPAETPVQVADAWVRAASRGETTAAYMEIRNGGSSPARLVGAQSPVAGRVEIHRTVEGDEVAHMEHVHAVEIPAGERVRLEPGGYHIMLLDLDRDLQPGETVTLTLEWEDGPTLTVEATVRP